LGRIAVTGKARSSIRRAARDALRRQYSELGRRLLIAAFRRINEDYSDDKLKKGLARLSQKSVEEVHATVGRGELPIADVIRAVVPEVELTEQVAAPRKRSRRERGQGEEGWFNLAKVMGLKFRWPGSGNAETKQSQVVPIRGLTNDVPVKFEEGGAVPGDRIVGVLDGKEDIRIFQIHSPKLRDYEHERWIDVTWDVDPDKPERFPAKIAITTINEPGTLAQIAQVIGEADGNIDNLRMTRRVKDFTEILIELEVWNLDELNQIHTCYKGKAVVSKSERACAQAARRESDS
jgi:GTP pyrophosphokinase